MILRQLPKSYHLIPTSQSQVQLLLDLDLLLHSRHSSTVGPNTTSHTMRSSNVLVVIGSGGMGIPVARRLGVGKRILLADFSADNLTIALTTLANEGYSTQTALLDVANYASVTELAQQAAKWVS